MKLTKSPGLRPAVTCLVLLVLMGCQALGIQAPKTFNEKLASGYVSVTTVRQLGTTLVTSGKLKPDDADNVLKQTDNARAGLDIARSLGDPAGADKLTSTLIILQGIQTYLASKGN